MAPTQTNTFHQPLLLLLRLLPFLLPKNMQKQGAFLLLLMIFSLPLSSPSLIQLPVHLHHHDPSPIPQSDVDQLEFHLNMIFLEAEFFLGASTGHDMDWVMPHLSMGGPPPVGVKKANIDSFTRDVATQFAFHHLGHLRGMKKHVDGFPRPLIDLSPECFGRLMNRAFNHELHPSFDPYANTINFLLASYLLPYIAVNGYVGSIPHLQNQHSRRLISGLLSVESAQDGVIRALLYQHATEKVHPYDITVAEFTNRISDLRNKLGGAGTKDVGIVMPLVKGPDSKLPGNFLAGNNHSLAYQRPPEEILRILYGHGSAHSPGGFFPAGAQGRIARSFLHGLRN